MKRVVKFVEDHLLMTNGLSQQHIVLSNFIFSFKMFSYCRVFKFKLKGTMPTLNDLLLMSEITI